MQQTPIETSDATLNAGEFVEIEIAELELREDLVSGLFSCCPCLSCSVTSID